MTKPWEGAVGPGWYALVEELDQAVLALVPGRRIDQIKEKFGGLRYYVTLEGVVEDQAVYDQVWDLISEAEARSYKTCEECGTTDEVTTDSVGKPYGWVRSLCPPCREAAEEARRKRWEEVEGA